MVELSENILDLDPDHGKIFRNYSTLVTPNFVQTAFGPNNWLKFCMQPLIVVLYILLLQTFIEKTKRKYLYKKNHRVLYIDH